MNRTQMEEYMRLLVEKQSRGGVAPGAGPEVAASPRSQYLVFAVGGREHAVPILKVKTVLAMPAVTPLPYVSEHCRGVINLRGRIVSLIDLRLLMNVEAHESKHTSVVVLESGARCVAMVVDSINRVLELESENAAAAVELLDVELMLGSVRT